MCHYCGSEGDRHSPEMFLSSARSQRTELKFPNNKKAHKIRLKQQTQLKDVNNNDIQVEEYQTELQKNKSSPSNSSNNISQRLFSNNDRNTVVHTKKSTLTNLLIVLVVFLTLWGQVSQVGAVCVWQGGGGFRLACGFRQSGLFRIRSLGGLKGYLGAGFTVGDEDGFKDSLTNTDPKYPSQGQGPGGYKRVGTDGEQALVGSHSQQVPVAMSLQDATALQKQEQLRYLQQIQAEQLLEHQVLEQQAAMQNQRQQKQLKFQQRRLPIPQSSYELPRPSPTPPDVKRGGLTKRASLWGWPFNKKKENKPPRGPMQRRPGPVGQQSQIRPVFFGPVQNPGQGPIQFAFDSRAQMQRFGSGKDVGRQGQVQGFDYDKDDYEVEEEGLQNQMPQPPQMKQFNLPNQMMLPPPSPSSFSRGGPPQQFRQIGDIREDISHLQMPNSPQLPHGLQMLKNTQNFGSVFRLVDKPHGIGRGPLGPGPMFHPHNQNIEGQLQPQNRQLGMEDDNVYLSGVGSLDKDALATAVYDPNIFPDIYFTTTEKGDKNGNSRMSEEHEHLGEDLRHLDEHDQDTNLNRVLESGNENENSDAFAQAPAVKRKKMRRRRKKFRLLKKKGHLNSDVDQNLEGEGQGQDQLQDQGQLDTDVNNQAEEEEQSMTSVPSRRKKKRRKLKLLTTTSSPTDIENETETNPIQGTSGEKIREAISSAMDDDTPLSGPSPSLPSYTFPPFTTTEATVLTTTKPPIKMSAFGYHEALDKKEKVEQDDPSNYHENGSETGGEEPSQSPYDPRFPPNHDMNRGRVPNKFIRQRGHSAVTTTTPTPYYHQRNSASDNNYGFGSSQSKPKKFFELNSPGSTAETTKFSPSTELSSSFVRFDSRESMRSIERTKTYNDQFYNSHFNKSSTPNFFQNNFGPTAFSNPGLYDFAPSFSQENPTKNFPQYPQPPEHHEILLPWERPSTTPRPVPVYPKNSKSVSNSYGIFNYPTVEKFGFPTVTTPMPMIKSPGSGERNLKNNIFGGEDENSNWEAPNFWGNIQQVDRYGPSSDFVTNDNFKRILDMERLPSAQPQPPAYDESHAPVDYPDDHSFSDYFGSTPASDSRWNKPRRKQKSRPTPTSAPFYISSTSTTAQPYKTIDLDTDHNNPNELNVQPNWDAGAGGSTESSQFGLKLEQLPVNEIDLDNFDMNNNGNFISSTTFGTTTTEIPEVIKSMRNKHGKKRKQKRPEVQIKIKGEQQPESQASKVVNQDKLGLDSVVLPNTAEVVDILLNEDLKHLKQKHPSVFGSETSDSQSGVESALRSDFNNGGHSDTSDFSNYFVPSNSYNNFNNQNVNNNNYTETNPFSNFESGFVNNPSGSGYGFISNNADFSKQIKQMTGGNGNSGSGDQFKYNPRNPNTMLQHRESSEEHRIVKDHQNHEIPMQNYGPGSPQQSQPPQIHQDQLPNIVPSPPDPVLNSGAIPIKSYGNRINNVIDNNFKSEFPTSIPVLRPPPIPDFNQQSDLHWETNQEKNNYNKKQESDRKVIPHPIQILNIQNNQPQPLPPQPAPVPQPHQPYPMQGNGFGYNDNFRHVHQNINQNPVQSFQNFQSTQPQSFQDFNTQSFKTSHDYSNSNFNMNINTIVKPNPSPAIKLVRPNASQNNYARPAPPKPAQKYYPEPHKPEETRNQFHNNYQPNFQTQQKQQFQKTSPPKKYSNDPSPPKQSKPMPLPPNKYNHNNNIPLPQNPYILTSDINYNTNQNNFNKPQGNIKMQSQPTKIPTQKFQPPPPPPKSGGGGFLSPITNMFSNPFGRASGSNNNKPPPNNLHQFNNYQHQPPPQVPQNQNQKHQINNHMNPLNTRFQPPPINNPKGVEVTYVDLDDNLNGRNPPRLVPVSNNNFRPPLPQQTRNHPMSQPQPYPQQPRNKPLSEKEKVIQAIATLNNVKYDVIQSVAEEQFGSEILDRIKSQKGQAAPITAPNTTPRPALFPMLSSFSTTIAPLAMGGISSLFGITQRPQSNHEDHEDQRMSPSGLSNLLSSFGGYGDSALNGPPRSKPSPNSMVSLSTDAITNLFNSLTSGESKPQTTTTTRRPFLSSPSSLENPGVTGDIKSLQAQLAKAIMAKANRKKYTSPLQFPGPTGAFGLVNHLANTKNYTQSQIATLKKLIALNNIEQKLNNQLGTEQTTAKGSLLNLPGPIKSMFSLSGPNNLFSNKMLLDPNSLNSINQVQSNTNNVNNDPTLMALKAMALKKAQNIPPQPQPNVLLKSNGPTNSADFRPIPVDLSAILSPSPPLEDSRKRRLTDIRNAPKSFYPANATMGFDPISTSSSLSTDFQCESQTFFPGLYADTSLGCKVFHLCAKTDAGYLLKSFRCPKETVFDQEVLKCNWNLYVECPGSESKYHFNKYLSQSFQFLKVLGEFSAGYQKNSTSPAG